LLYFVLSITCTVRDPRTRKIDDINGAFFPLLSFPFLAIYSAWPLPVVYLYFLLVRGSFVDEVTQVTVSQFDSFRPIPFQAAHTRWMFALSSLR